LQYLQLRRKLSRSFPTALSSRFHADTQRAPSRFKPHFMLCSGAAR
jgi:hypothetical protein